MAFSPKIAPLERFCLRHGSKPHAGEGKQEPRLQSGPSPACGGRWRALARRKGAAACAGAWGTPLHHADAWSPPFEHSSHGLLTPASAGAGSKIAPQERFCLRHGSKSRKRDRSADCGPAAEAAAPTLGSPDTTPMLRIGEDADRGASRNLCRNHRGGMAPGLTRAAALAWLGI
jgi:hypothetical protein